MDSDTLEGGEAYEQLGKLYDVWCAEVVEDVSFYVGLADALAAELGRDSVDVIELGAGSGRISVPLACSGHRVVAIDASASQLARLHARASRTGVDDGSIETMRGDMLQLDTLVPAASVDLVLIPFRGALHVTPDRDRLFAGIRHALRPHGALAFDVFHPSAEQIELTHGRWHHRRDERTASGTLSFRERARYLPELADEPGGLKLEVDVRCERDGAVEREALLELQLVPADRWAASLQRAGFVVDGAYGWFDARPLEDEDDDSIWVARLDGQ